MAQSLRNPFMLIHLLLINVIAGQNIYNATNMQRNLWKDLMADYDKNIKPELYPHQQINVRLRPELNHIESLNEKEQVLTTYGTLSSIVVLKGNNNKKCVKTWRDYSLSWNPADYGNIRRIIVPGSNIWRPEFVLANGADSSADIAAKDASRVAIYPDGIVDWVSVFKWTTGCPVNLRYFPSDEQACVLWFASYVYGAEEQNLTILQQDYVPHSLMENGEWYVTDSTLTERQDVYSGEDWNFTMPVIEYNLVLRRKPTYFMINLILPSLFMSVMTPLVFCLPPESGEKISLGITNLLSYSVMILMVSEVTPRTSHTVPIISMYIIFSMGLSAFALFATTLVLAIHHHCPYTPVPSWVHSCYLKGLGTVLCLRPKRSNEALRCIKKVWASKLAPMPFQNAKKGSTSTTGVRHAISQQNDIRTNVEELQEEKIVSEKEDQYKRDWIDLARVTDRFLLVIYCLVLAVLKIVILASIA